MAGKNRVQQNRSRVRKKSYDPGWRLVAWLACIGALTLAAVLFDSGLARINHPRIDPNDIGRVEVGRRVYEKLCATCHGASLEGAVNWRQRSTNGRLPAPPLDATGDAWRHRDAELFAIVRGGPAAYPSGYSSDMPAFGGELTDNEIAAVLAYIKSRWPADVRSSQVRTNLLPWTRIAH